MSSYPKSSMGDTLNRVFCGGSGAGTIHGSKMADGIVCPRTGRDVKLGNEREDEGKSKEKWREKMASHKPQTKRILVDGQDPS